MELLYPHDDWCVPTFVITIPFHVPYQVIVITGFMLSWVTKRVPHAKQNLLYLSEWLRSSVVLVGFVFWIFVMVLLLLSLDVRFYLSYLYHEHRSTIVAFIEIKIFNYHSLKKPHITLFQYVKTREIQIQLKDASGCGNYPLHWRPVGDLLLLFFSMVGLLSLWHIPHFHSQFYWEAIWE